METELSAKVTLGADDQLTPVAERLESAVKRTEYATLGLLEAIEDAFSARQAKDAEKLTKEIEAQNKAATKAAISAMKAGNNWKVAFKKAEGAAGSLGKKISSVFSSTAFKVGGGIAAYLGIREVVGAATHGRMEMESLTDAVTGVHVAFKQWGDDVPIADKIAAAGKEAKGVWSDMEALSLRLAMPVQGLQMLYANLAGPVFGTLHKSQEEMNDLLTKAAEGAKVFGADASQLGKTVAKALSLGVVEGEDPLSLHLRSALGNMSKLTAEERYRKVSKELSGLGETADTLATSMVDVVFRIQKFFGDFIRDVSGPALTYVLDKLDAWRDSLEDAAGSGKDLVKEIGDKLLKGVKAVEKVGGFILDHWKEIAFVIGGIKFGGLAGSAAAGAGGMLSAFTGPLGAAGSQLSAFSSKLPLAVGALGVFAAALHAGAELLDEWQKEEISAKGTAEGLSTLLEKSFTGSRETAQKVAIGLGVMTKQGKVNAALIERGFSQMGDDRLERYAKALGLGPGASAGIIAAKFAEELRKGYVVPKEPPPSADVGNLAAKAKVPKAVNIQNFHGGIRIQQDFKEADPGRVFVRFTSDLEKLSERRQQSNEAEVFGT